MAFLDVYTACVGSLQHYMYSDSVSDSCFDEILKGMIWFTFAFFFSKISNASKVVSGARHDVNTFVGNFFRRVGFYLIVYRLLTCIWQKYKNDMYNYYSPRFSPEITKENLTKPLSAAVDYPIVVGHGNRGDKPPQRHYLESVLHQSHVTAKSFISSDDGRSFNENTVGSSGFRYTGSRPNYSQGSHRAKIVGAGNVSVSRANLVGVESEADKRTGVATQQAVDTTSSTEGCVTGSRDFSLNSHRSTIGAVPAISLVTKHAGYMGMNYMEPDKKIGIAKQTVDSNAGSIAGTSGYVSGSRTGSINDTKSLDHFGSSKGTSTMHNATHTHYKDLYGVDGNYKVDDWPWKDRVTTNNKQQEEENNQTTAAPTTKFGYNKPTYAVLVGNSVKVYSTSVFASLPTHSKFMVKERQKDSSGVTRVKLALKSCDEKIIEEERDGRVRKVEVEKDEVGERLHFRENSKSTGFIIYTCDKRFQGNIKYPLPSGRATDSKIGKGGNGFVFTIYHERKQYAVKKTVYRSNEVNVHSALNHKNILPLLAVLMGERHERHSGRFYCFHFMPKMDYDLRQILSSREVGCLKHFYNHCSKDTEKWQTGFNNIKFILVGTLEALAYLHANGYVHRDVKASNIMIKMQCRCQPLSCRCSSKFQVKLGDFDSAGTVPGLGIKEPTDQMIKFASILPLGTPGYRAPEVSMHITLSGPYETLYTFAVDMWSFGCLCLNICIGKTAALKQREEASLLLSTNHPCGKELWEKTTKTTTMAV